MKDKKRISAVLLATVAAFLFMFVGAKLSEGRAAASTTALSAQVMHHEATSSPHHDHICPAEVAFDSSDDQFSFSKLSVSVLGFATANQTEISGQGDGSEDNSEDKKTEDKKTDDPTTNDPTTTDVQTDSASYESDDDEDFVSAPTRYMTQPSTDDDDDESRGSDDDDE